MSCNPLDVKVSHKGALIWEIYGQIDKKTFSVSVLGDPFLEIGDPLKGRDP
jgi:hypothetical protein